MNQFKKCSVVLLSTNQKAIIHWNEDSHFFLSNTPKLINSGFELFITSDEEIKEGDWYYNTVRKEITKCENKIEEESNKLFPQYAKKIIATTDTSLEIKTFYEIEGNQEISLPQPSQQFIEKYIEEYNKGNVITDVLVEYIDNGEEGWSGSNEDGEPIWNEKIELKVNPKGNTITIKKVKDSWNREEVFKLCRDSHYAGSIGIDRDIWIEQNL